VKKGKIVSVFLSEKRGPRSLFNLSLSLCTDNYLIMNKIGRDKNDVSHLENVPFYGVFPEDIPVLKHISAPFWQSGTSI
jgi:hypothetical protein